MEAKSDDSEGGEGLGSENSDVDSVILSADSDEDAQLLSSTKEEETPKTFGHIPTVSGRCL